jgi:predicted ATP-grasp superfamily ATP-dependent carboligase
VPSAPDTSTPAVVLHLHDHGGLGAVRSLGRLGVPVSAVHDPKLGRTPAIHSRYLRNLFPFPIEDAPAEETVAYLRETVAPKLGRPAVLLASEDLSGMLIAEHAERLRPSFIVPDQDPRLPRSLVDKKRLYETCIRTGTPTPSTAFPQDGADVEGFARSAHYPVVLKAIDGWRVRRTGDVITIIVDTPEELIARHRAMADGDNLNLMLQEYIPGSAESVWTYMAYIDGDQKPRVAFVGNKRREYPVDAGLTTLGVSVTNPRVTAAADSFLGQIGYRGIVDLDFRLDPRDDQLKPLDLNPRPGANFRVFVAANGIDVVRAAYLDLTGQPVPDSPPQPGRRWLVEDYDLAAARGYMARGRLTLRGYLNSLRGVQETAWWAADDPQPFLHMLRRFGTGAAGFVRRRLGR